MAWRDVRAMPYPAEALPDVRQTARGNSVVRVYVSGPMSGIPHFNFHAFDEAAATLRTRGFDVVSPAELDDPKDRAKALASPDGLSYDGKSWGDFLARDVRVLADDGIEAVCVLPGWENSRGARLETFVAKAILDLPVFSYEDGRLVPLKVLLAAWVGLPITAIGVKA